MTFANVLNLLWHDKLCKAGPKLKVQRNLLLYDMAVACRLSAGRRVGTGELMGLLLPSVKELRVEAELDDRVPFEPIVLKRVCVGPDKFV